MHLFQILEETLTVSLFADRVEYSVRGDYPRTVENEAGGRSTVREGGGEAVSHRQRGQEDETKSSGILNKQYSNN